MNWDDIVYLLCLFFSIIVGNYIRLVEDKETKKWISTLLGFLIVTVVSGVSIVHPIICTFVNAFIIFMVDKRVCHIYSFAFQFGYLFFFRTSEYFGIPYAPAHTNLVQMVLTLKLVGLAFEVHDAAKLKEDKKKKEDSDESEELEFIQPDFIDIFHYAFCYVGVLTGPFYKYKTYSDWLNTPFSKYANCYEHGLIKLTYVPLYAVLFLIVTYLYPLDYAKSDEFYNERSVWYRIWFINPTFFIFRMRIYIGLLLSESVCCMAGLGAYPTVADPKPGHGPSKLALAKELATDDTKASKQSYNFDTINNIYPWGCESVVTVREGMKCWNICVQYWLAVYVYKRLPRNQFRLALTTFVSAFWHGMYAGHYFCICTVALYLPVEDLYMKHFRKDASPMAGKIWDLVIWFFKLQAFSYMAMTFLLLRVDLALKYWASIYFIGHILALIFYLGGMAIVKQRKKKNTVTKNNLEPQSSKSN